MTELCFYIYIYLQCTYVCVGGHIAALQMDSRLLSVMLSLLWSSSLLIYHSCIVLPVLSTRFYLLVHQYATSACVRLWPGPVWGICDWRGTVQKGDLWEEGEDEEKKRGSKSLCLQWLGYSRQHCQHFPQRVAGNQGGAVLGRDLLMYTVQVCGCVCVRTCTWRTLITLIISSNYLQTANEFLRNPIMLCMCSHHHPFCTAAINLLINKYN